MCGHCCWLWASAGSDWASSRVSTQLPAHLMMLSHVTVMTRKSRNKMPTRQPGSSVKLGPAKAHGDMGARQRHQRVAVRACVGLMLGKGMRSAVRAHAAAAAAAAPAAAVRAHVWQGRRRRRQRRRARAALTRELGHPWPSVGLIDVQLRRLTPWEAEARWLEGGSSVPQRPSCLHSLTTVFCVTWRREGPAGFQRSASAALARRPKRLQLPQTHPPLHGFWSARRAFCGSCTNVASWRGAPAAAACS